METFEEKMAAFGFEKHQEFLTYYKTLKNLKLTVKDVENFLIKRRKIVQQEEETWNKKMPRCPKCSSVMGLFPVNTISADQTGDDSMSMWFCTNKNCLHTIYNKEAVNLVIEKHLLKQSLERRI